jgi:hypothetical protein
MRKTTRKLMLRKETVRALSGQDLSRAIGGLETDAAEPYPQTGLRQCLTSGFVAALDVPRDGD